MTRKAQTAMEFLMTYGWAILVMLVVIAVLFYLGVFNPVTVSPKACVMPAGFSCYGFKISGNGVLNLSLVQSTGHTIDIEQIACSDRDDPSGDFVVVVNGTIYSGEKATIITTCHKSGITGDPPVPGEYYKGVLYIIYMDEDTNIRHKIRGEVSYQVEES